MNNIIFVDFNFKEVISQVQWEDRNDIELNEAKKIETYFTMDDIPF